MDVPTARAVIEIAGKGPRGNVLTLGKVAPAFTLETLLELLAGQGRVKPSEGTWFVEPRQKALIDRYVANGRLLSHQPQHAARGWISDELFFGLIGFDAVASVDHGDFADADFAHDFNVPGLVHAVGTYDLVFDPGLLEGVFHLPHFLRNTFDVLKVGGLIVHHTSITTGKVPRFFTLTAHAFVEYYRTNAFDAITVAQITGTDVAHYCARKVHASTFDRFPGAGTGPGALR